MPAAVIPRQNTNATISMTASIARLCEKTLRLVAVQVAEHGLAADAAGSAHEAVDEPAHVLRRLRLSSEQRIDGWHGEQRQEHGHRHAEEHDDADRRSLLRAGARG